MLFGDMKLSDVDFDLTTSEGRANARKKIDEEVDAGNEPAAKKKIIKRLLANVLGLMDDMPKPFLLVREVKQETKLMSDKLARRSKEFGEMASGYLKKGVTPKCTYVISAAESYMTVAGAALAAAASALEELEPLVNKIEDEEGRTPTEAPPPPEAPAPTAAEAPLG